jgi:hypothetical protein
LTRSHRVLAHDVCDDSGTEGSKQDRPHLEEVWSLNECGGVVPVVVVVLVSCT